MNIVRRISNIIHVVVSAPSLSSWPYLAVSTHVAMVSWSALMQHKPRHT
jgi:hypothetical protein